MSSQRLLWSVIMVNDLPRRYCLHFLTIVTMTCSSLMYVEAWINRGPKSLLKNAIRCPCCISTTLMAVADTSVSTTKGSAKLGRAKTGALVISSLSWSNAGCEDRV